MAYTLETTVGEILKDTKAVEVLERYVPGDIQESYAGVG